MINVSRVQAKNRFTASEKSQRKALDEREQAAEKVRENTARLRALRLAKEAEDLAAGTAKKSSSKKQTTKIS